MNDLIPHSPALVRTLLESAAQGILVVDQRGQIVLANARAESLFRALPNTLLGRPVGDLLPERYLAAYRGRGTGHIRHPLEHSMGSGLEVVAHRLDGSEFVADISLSFAEVDGEIHAMCFVNDSTIRVQMQRQLHDYSQWLEEQVEARTQELHQAQAKLLEQELVQRDLELARRVQASLLPRQLPTLRGYEFAARARPARYVSGDLYDFFPCDLENCHFVLADISGKGVPAALLASTARTLVHSETAHENEPAAILSNVERMLQEDLDHAEAFITVMAARLDGRLGRLCYANAGHTEAVWYRPGASQRLPATGLPLGVVGRFPSCVTALQQETIYLRPGDLLVFYSDGVTEATNAHGELYGFERLSKLVSLNAPLPAEELADTILQSVEAFCDGGPRSDDLTLLVLKVLPRTVEFSAPASLEQLRETVGLIHQCALAYGEEFAYQIELAASEVVTNIIEHACEYQGQLEGQIALHAHTIRVDLYDDGGLCDLASIPDAPLGDPQQGGYGLHIARQLLDELTYTVEAPPSSDAEVASTGDVSPPVNHWRLVKTIPGKTSKHVRE